MGWWWWWLYGAAGGARRDSRGLWLFLVQAVHHVSAQVVGASGLLPASTLNVKNGSGAADSGAARDGACTKT